MKIGKTALLGLVFLMGFVTFNFCFTKIALNEVGVKVSNFGSGTQQRDYEPGYHFTLPGVHRMYRLDPTVQALHMIKGSDPGALEVTGIDQYKTRFDITVLYRIEPGKAHLVSKAVGVTQDRIASRLESKANKSILEALGALKTQDIYNVELREKARQAAKDALAKELEPVHIQLVDILVRAIEYDRNLEELLVEKQLFDQGRALTEVKRQLEGELQKTEAISRETDARVQVINEEMKQEVETIVAETDARIHRIEADADLEVEKLLAEADRERRERRSAGELARTEAKAKGEKAINEAYLGLGGQAYITRQMVENLDFGEIEVNTNVINPFDVSQFLAMLGLETDGATTGDGE